MLSPDGTVIIGCRDLLPILPGRPMIGFHPSLLPHGRGRCPVQWAILARELCGMSLFRMAAEADAGPILGQLAFGKLESSAEFYELIQAFAPHLLRQVIRAWACTWEGIPQARRYPAFPALDDYRQEAMTSASRDRVYSGPYKPLRRYQ
jgi:methionyl-tRNA formyltransferase